MQDETENGDDEQHDEAAASPAPPDPAELARQEVEGEIKVDVPDAPTIDILPFQIVKRHDKKTVKLLANSGEEKAFSGKRIWFKYEFSELTFVEFITIDVGGYSGFSDFELAYTLPDGSRTLETLSPRDGRIIHKVNGFISEISFRPPRRSLSTGIIEKVTIFGFGQSEASKFGEYANSLDERRIAILEEIGKKKQKIIDSLAELKALERKRDEIDHKISEGKKKAQETNSQIEGLQSRRDEMVTRIEALEQSIRENQQKIDDQKNSIAEASDVRSKLAHAIIDKQSRLKTLTENINLFPSELSDFVSQGARDVRLYALLSAIPIVVIAIMFAILIEGGVDLTTKITGETDINILAILVSRMPFVVVAVTVVTACYYLARMFVLEMVRVNRQKLSLSKIGIIAKDISYSVENELNFSDDEKYSRRLTIKMDMLRDHLKDYLSKDFEPSLPKRSPFEQMQIPGLRRRRGKSPSQASKRDAEAETADESDETNKEEGGEEVG